MWAQIIKITFEWNFSMVSVKRLLKLVATAVIFISFTAQALPII